MSRTGDNLELDLLCGVLDAFPSPAALLGRGGRPAYVNAQGEELGLDAIPWEEMPEVRDCLGGTALPGASRTLPGSVCVGTLELYPVRNGEQTLGILLLFHPEKVPASLYIDALPTVSEAMDRVWDKLRRLSMLGTTALMTGEHGVGKESFARALHRMGPQARHPFAALPAYQADERSLKTAAANAGKGTLFIDGADDLPEQTQAALLLLLEDKSEAKGLFHGRLCLSASPDLAVKAREERFNKALYQRIHLMPVEILPLRERPEDILPAASAYLRRQAELLGRDLQGFSPDARAALLTNRWAGNHPALEEAVRVAAAVCPGGLVLASHLPGEARSDLQEQRRAFTRERIVSLLDVYGHTVEGKRACARELGIGLSTLYRILGGKTPRASAGNRF